MRAADFIVRAYGGAARAASPAATSGATAQELFDADLVGYDRSRTTQEQSDGCSIREIRVDPRLALAIDPLNPSTLYAGTNSQWFRYDAFVTKLNAAGDALVYSTYFGGHSDDSGFGIAPELTPAKVEKRIRDAMARIARSAA